jgi:hypothetical protein
MKRREFVQSFLLLSGGLVLSTESVFASAKAVKKIRGTVKAAGKKLAGVVVSDGYSVVQTDRKGRYEMPLNEQANHVYLSVPAGYAFPNEKGIARHYQHISASDTKQQYDFELTPLQQDDTSHRFIVWADPQVKNKGDVKQMMTQSVPDVQELVASFGAGALVHGMTVGDIVWDKHELFKDYDEAVAGTGIPFFQVLGNHDMDYNKGGDEASDDTFEELYGPTHYSYNRGKVHYVVLDDVRYLGTDRNYDGYLSEQQLAWLKKDLAFVPKDHLVVIGVHIPVHRGVKNNEDLYQVLGDRKVHIMSGHTHFNGNVVNGNVYEHVHGTLCGAWWTGPICGDGAPRGYGVYEVEGTELKWYYKSTGLPKEHQLSVHVEELTNQKRMMANVWNWDPEWKVEWWADEQYMGALENVTAFDPVAVALYKGDQLPKGRTFAEPIRTDHLFVAHFKPEVQTLKVVATDRFGNRYEQQVAASKA